MQKNIKILSVFMRYVLLACVVAFGWIAIVATGGGGGGGGSSEISYTGVETQAAIDENNAPDLTLGAYGGGETGLSTGIAGGGMLSGMQAEGTDTGASLNLFRFARTLEEVLRRADPAKAMDSEVPAGLIIRESGTVSAPDCDGNAAYTIRMDDQTGDFTGSLTFNSYCSQGYTYSGMAQFSGSIDTALSLLQTFEFRFRTLQASTDTDTLTLSGHLAMELGPEGETATLTMDLLIRSELAGNVCWLRNYEIRVESAGSCMYYDYSGRFYHPDHGYVEFTTEINVRICDDFPSDGVLLFTGADGTDGPSRARLTFVSTSTLIVEADTDGDGAFDDYFQELGRIDAEDVVVAN